MTISVKYFVTNPNGSYLDWAQRVDGYGTISSGELVFIGGFGDDIVYLQAGTSANLTDMQAGNNRIYLTGSLDQYTQSIDQSTGVYTFTRTAGLSAGQVEVVKFTITDDLNQIYFADGHIAIDASNSMVFDGNAFLALSAAALQAGGTPADPVTTAPITPFSVPDKIYVTDPHGVTLPLLQQPGQNLQVIGSAGDDNIYVARGTSVNASNLGLGNDHVYLTGKLADYSQAIDQNTGVYTLSRTAGLPAGQTEVVKILVSNEDDLITFADGTISLNGETNPLIFDLDNFIYKPLAYDPLSLGPVTPGLEPVLVAGHALTYAENAPATVIDAALTLSDPDDGQLTGATVSISGGFHSGDVLAFTNQNGISGSYNAATGVLTLSGTASVANYQAALRAVTFSNPSDAISAADRTIAWQVTDPQNNHNATATSTIHITTANDAPTGAVTIAGTVAAGQALTASNTLADPDGLGSIAYQWQISTNGTAWSDIAGATANSYTVASGQGGSYFRAVAQYTDGQGTLESINSNLLIGHTAPTLTATQALDNVTNLDVRSALVLTFDQNILLGTGQIKIKDDMGTAGWTVRNSYSGESLQDVTDNDVVITLTNGCVSGFTVGGVDRSAYMANAVTVSGNKLIINPADASATWKSYAGSKIPASNNTWNFDWDFGANYHVELAAGVVKNSDCQSNAAMNDSSVLNFTTVAPSGGNADTATGIASTKLDTSSGAVVASSTWHNSHVLDDTTAGVAMNFSSGSHALYIQSQGGSTKATTITGKVALSGMGADDVLYMDNLGNTLMATTEGLTAASWTGTGNNLQRTLGNTSGFAQNVTFVDYLSTGYTNIAGLYGDRYMENNTHYNANVVVFG